MAKSTATPLPPQTAAPAAGELPPQGQLGLKIWSGILSEERKPELIGQTGRDVYAEMSHDPVIGGALHAFDVLIRSVSWRTDPATESPEDLALADFVDSCRLDMAHGWLSFISEIGACWIYGWHMAEEQFKFRRGDQPEPVPYEKLKAFATGSTAGLFTPENPAASRFNDGKLGWDALATRSQDSLFRWLMSTDGKILGMQQRPPPSFNLCTVSMDRALLFRTRSRRNNPEGMSLLRPAYDSWFLKRRLRALEAIFVERMCGYPVLYVPESWTHGDANTAEKAKLQAALDMVSKMKVHELMGAVLPSIFDAGGNKLMDLTTLQLPATSGNLGIGEMIQRYDRDTALCMLAGVLLLGHQRQGTTTVGSLASSSMTDLLTAALAAYLDMVEDQINSHAVPRLLTLNGMPTDDPPQIKHGDVNLPDWPALAAMITSLSGAGAQLFPNLPLVNTILDRLNLPQMHEEAEPPPLPAPEPQPGDAGNAG